MIVNEPGQSIRLSDWLDSRSPRPPAALSARLAELAGDRACAEDQVSIVLLEMAEQILRTIGNDRGAATDLLAADALITYAIESAAESRDDLESFAAQAASRIASVTIG